jgi:hypothetical protein
VLNKVKPVVNGRRWKSGRVDVAPSPGECRTGRKPPDADGFGRRAAPVGKVHALAMTCTCARPSNLPETQHAQSETNCCAAPGCRRSRRRWGAHGRPLDHLSVSGVHGSVGDLHMHLGTNVKRGEEACALFGSLVREALTLARAWASPSLEPCQGGPGASFGNRQPRAEGVCQDCVQYHYYRTVVSNSGSG